MMNWGGFRPGGRRVSPASGSGGPVTLERAETRNILLCSNMGRPLGLQVAQPSRLCDMCGRLEEIRQIRLDSLRM